MVRLGQTDRAFVEARDVVKVYRSGVAANDRISFDAQLGEIVAILGPNGAGKTTFMLQLLGLLAPSSGTICVGAVDVIANPAGVKRLASYQPQGHMAMGGVEARHVLAYTARLRGLTMAEARRQAADVTSEFGLQEVVNTPLNRLSGGWRRLVDVAVAFMGRPQLIVLDEPTNDLDPIHRQMIWGKLNALRQSREVTCLVVTHNLLEVERVVDRTVIISRGRVVAAGSPGALKQRLDSNLCLDVYLRAEETAEDGRLALSMLGPAHRIHPGHLRFFLPRDDVPRAMALLLGEHSSAWLDDFRLAPPSLEDVYLHFEENERANHPA